MITRIKASTRKRAIVFVMAMLIFLIGAVVTSVVVYANSYYTVRINYYFTNGSHAHDPYIATFEAGEKLNYDVTNPNVNGFEPMKLTDDGNDPTALPTGGTSAEKIHIETNSLDRDYTYDVYYVAGLTHYAARYYLQNIYDDLYTLDRDRTNANQNRLGKTGSSPDDLESEEITGFTSLFHEPDAIAADGSTVFRVYYDRNYYSINFDLGEGGYGVDPIYAKYETVYRIDEPKRMGYTFLGWARTDKDSSTNTYDATGEDEDGWHYIDASGNVITETQAKASPVSLQGNQTIPAKNTYYKAIWTPGTTHFTVMYWLENADNDGYTALLAKDVTQVYDNNQLTDVTAGMTITPEHKINNATKYAVADGVITSSQAGNKAKSERIVDLFNFNLGYANPNDSRNDELDPDDPNYNPSSLNYKYKFEYDTASNANANHTCNRIIDFNDISPGTSNELAGCGDFFEMNTSENTSDPRYITDTSVSVRGDGTTRFNVFFKRKTFTLKFYYARQGYTDGELDPNKFSLTNSTKAFNNNSTEKEYLKTTSKNVLEAIAMGSWEQNSAESLPTIKDEYKQLVTEGYDDFTDSRYKGYYRYYYYQLQAKYNEPLTNKWLIDALNTVHRKGSSEAEICYPGSIATEYYNKYYQDRKSSGNYTVKGIYEKLDKGILFTDSARNTMKQNNIDYTELHFLISWTNTSYNNGWNSSITRVLHFRYENYTELLPREVEIVEHSGEQALINEGVYTDVRQFPTKVNENGSWVSKTKWYGLSTNHVYETIDSGNQYDRNKSLSEKNKNVRLNQTPTAMTGFELEYYRTVNGLITLDDFNTIIDWSEDTDNYRRCTIKFFYRRHEYTLKYRNGNHKDESRTRTVMYGAPINSTYQVSENGHEAGDYRYYWPDPEYFDPNRADFYTFEGWYNDPRYEEPFDLDTQTMPADDYTLFAKWSPKHIDVIFYDDYDDFYIDRKGQHPEKRIVLGQDEDENDITDISVDYGSYVPLMSIPVNDDSPDNPRPRLNPIAEGASFAGWYYIRNRVPVRYEPENVPVTALNDEATGDNAKLRLFAEWVTKDVAKYKVEYVNANDTSQEIAAPTTGRAYVWKTKTFNAKSGEELYDEYKWTQEGEDAGTNWWPIDNSSSMVIKANNSDDEYAPNKLTFRYIQKSKVHYKVQYLDASTRTPLYQEKITESSHASVKEDARIIPGFVPTTASQTLVLTASSNPDSSEAEAEELRENVITFLYEENKTDYLYEVEYLTQDIGKNTYSLYTTETLTTPITTEGQPVSLAVNTLFSTTIPRELEDAGFYRVAGGCYYTVSDLDGVKDDTQISVADNGTVSISNSDKKTISIKFNRNSYRYKYLYVDHTAEKNYLNYIEAHKDDPDPTAGAPWDGVLQTFDDPSYMGQVEQLVTINPATDYTYVDTQNDTTTNYTRITNNDGTLNDVTVTIQPVEAWNVVKIYYRKDIERELSYKMVCVNDNSETDYYNDGTRTPKFGRLNFSMQTVLEYDDIQNIVFHDTNNEVIDNTDPQHPIYLHLHKYTFLGWYTTPNYDEEHPEENRITASRTLTKEDLGTDGELPDRDTKYYALVKQDMVKMDVMFYYTDDYTVDEFRAEDDDDELAPDIRQAVNNENNAQAADKDKVHPTGERVGKKVTFTAPNGYINHTDVPWHRNDGYSLSMTDIDQKVYKYKFAEWWEIDESNNGALIRHDNWNSADGWDPDQLSQQVARNKNNYLIAVYARRSDITELPYKIKYQFQTRDNGVKNLIETGTLSGSELNESSADCKITNDGDFRLTDEFILSMAPYESNHGETLCWTDDPDYVEKTSFVGNPSASSDEEKKDRILTTITAVRNKKKVHVHYKFVPDDDDPSNDYIAEPIETIVGANRNSNTELRNIDISKNLPDGKTLDQFSYWEVKKSARGKTIAKCSDPCFGLCIMDNYWITPVFDDSAAYSKSAVLDPRVLAQGDEDWLAWTWNEGDANGVGSTVIPDSQLNFSGLGDYVIFARVSKGTTTLGDNWSNVWNKTDNLQVQSGNTFKLTRWYGDSNFMMYGIWGDITLTHLDYSRNRWTDESDSPADPKTGSTDLLYTDFEIAFKHSDNKIYQNTEDFRTGVVFELCATLPANVTFDPTKNYGAVTNYSNMKNSILGQDNASFQSVYEYKTGKNRNIMAVDIPTEKLTNHDRIEFGIPFKNAYKADGTYTNSRYLMKVTAFVRDKGDNGTFDTDDNITYSNSMYICLSDIAAKELAVHGANGIICEPITN